MTPHNTCGATCRDGTPCQNPPIKGGTVCRMHGGSAPQVQEKAQERLDRMADEVTAEVQRIIEDLVDLYHEADEEGKLKIQSAVRGHWLAILNRTGHGPTEGRKHEHDVGGGLQDLVGALQDGYLEHEDGDSDEGE